MDLYWQVNGASGWNAETVAGSRTTYSAPSLAPDGTAASSRRRARPTAWPSTGRPA